MKFKYDLHVHTKEVSACARLSMEEIIDEYIKEGYAGLIITDHFRKGYFRKCKDEKEYEKKIKDFFYSYDKGIKYSKDKDFYIGLGVEIKFNNDKNDYLVYGLKKEDYLENKFMIEMNLEDFYNKFKNKAIIIQAHPHRKKHSKLANLNYLHGIEIRNLNPKHNNNNHLTEKVYEENPHLIATSGSDVHKREDLCRGGIYTSRKINSDEDFLEILKNKAFEVI